MKHRALILTIVLILLFASACGSKPAEAPAAPPPVENPATDPPAATQAPQAEPAVETPAPPPAEAPAAADTPAPLEIVHVEFPADEAAIDWTQEIRDCNTGERITLGATTIVGSGCDDWSISKIERPVAAFNDTFIPALDINRAYMGNARNWYYASIRLHNSSAGSLPADLAVALELDTDIDSRGEYLITAAGMGTEWSTDGVQVRQDANGDVGGDQALRPDGTPGDGYETLLFDVGLGDDPDLAWARISPANGAVIEIAFKESLMPESGVYAWWTWTSQGALDPAAMEVVDALNPADAWRMDNTCGWIYGARPSTLLRNLCEIITPTPTPTATATDAPRRAEPTQRPGQPQPTVCPAPDWCNESVASGAVWNYDTCTCDYTQGQ